MMKRTILYIDDEEINLFLFRHTMEAHFEILTVSSGQQGLEVMKAHLEIIAVITDMRMPEMNGLEFVEQARKDFPDIVYIILTGYSFNEEIDKALERGVVSQFVTKPYEVTHLADLVDKLVDQKQAKSF